MLGHSCGNDPSLGPFRLVFCFLIKALCLGPLGTWLESLGCCAPASPRSVAVKTPTSFTLLVYLLFFDGTVIKFLVVVT